MSNKKKQTGRKHQESTPVVDTTTSSAKAVPEVTVNTDINRQLWAKIFMASLLAVFALMTVMSFGFGLSGDEVDMNEYGKAILKYFTSFGADDTVLHLPRTIDRDGVLMYYGGFFDLLCAVANTFSPFDEYATRHILNAWTGFIAIYFSGRITAMITDKRVATLCVWLMFLSPFFLGHAMNNPKDIPLAAAYIAAIFFIIRFFGKYPDVKWQDYLWVILAIGIAINVRVAGILLIPYLFVYAGFIYLSKAFSKSSSIQLSHFAKPVIIISIAGYLAGSLFWPYGQQNPLSNPLTALSEMSNFKINLAQIWEGEKVMSGELPQSYLIKSFFITNTYALLAGLILFFVFISRAAKSKTPHITYFIAFTALFPLFYIIYKKSNVYHAWRHVLFIFPSVVVMASLGWSYINAYIAETWKKAYAGIAIAAVLLIEPILFIVPTYPNTVTYHNQFVGGVQGAYGNYEVDYYYNSVKQCVDYFIEHEMPQPGDTVLVLSNAMHLIAPELRKYKNVHIDYVRYHEKDQKAWDYAIFHTALIPLDVIQSENWVPASAVFTAEVKGKPLCVLLKRTSQDDVLGFQALQNGDRETALAYFMKYLAKDSTNVNVLAVTARVLMEMNQMDNAYLYANKAYTLDKTGIETKRVYGMALAYKGEGEKARTIFKEIVSERPDFVMGYYYMGMVEKGMGLYKDALVNFDRVAKAYEKQDPSISAECYMHMGDIFKAQGDVGQANNMYQRAASLQ
jgi:tetratricopeptide (TPR) repeat protein